MICKKNKKEFLIKTIKNFNNSKFLKLKNKNRQISFKLIHLNQLRILKIKLLYFQQSKWKISFMNHHKSKII